MKLASTLAVLLLAASVCAQNPAPVTATIALGQASIVNTSDAGHDADHSFASLIHMEGTQYLRFLFVYGVICGKAGDWGGL